MTDILALLAEILRVTVGRVHEQLNTLLVNGGIHCWAVILDQTYIQSSEITHSSWWRSWWSTERGLLTTHTYTTEVQSIQQENGSGTSKNPISKQNMDINNLFSICSLILRYSRYSQITLAIKLYPHGRQPCKRHLIYSLKHLYAGIGICLLKP